MIKNELPNIGLDGAKWARGVFTCPFCNYQLREPGDLYFHIIGLASTSYGTMKVAECPNCFEKYYSHASESDIEHICYFAKNNQHLN